MQTKIKAPRRKPASARVAKMIYLPPELARALEGAALEAAMSQSTYVIQAIKAQLGRKNVRIA